MDEEFKEDGIEWDGRGYFGCPDLPPGVRPEDVEADPWLRWAHIFQALKAGDWGPAEALLDLYRAAPTPIFEEVCYLLLGDAGSSAMLDRVARILEGTNSLEVALDFSDAVRTRGLLADVPLLLGVHERFAESDAAMFAIHISALLEPRPGPLASPEDFASPAAYRAAVLARCADRADKFGTDRIPVLHGERFGVVRLAERILRALPERHFPMHLRRRFEASTGIDCSAFYRDGVVQPGDAARIVERFLDSHDSERYEDGARYFFGHRVP